MDGGECVFFFFFFSFIERLYPCGISRCIQLLLINQSSFSPYLLYECLLILGAKIESPIYKWTESNDPKGAIKTILPLMRNSCPPVTLIN